MYRFRKQEIEAMKGNIICHCNSERVADEHGNKSARRLRLALEMKAMCTACGKKERQKRYRALALYENLTKQDLPTFATV